MITTLGTLFGNSIAGLAWLSPLQALVAIAALSYAVGGLVVLQTVGRRPVTSHEPVRARTEPVYRTAA
jgi:hypothetical protein